MKDDTFTHEGNQYRVERRGPAVPDAPGGGITLIFPVDPPESATDPAPPRKPVRTIYFLDGQHRIHRSDAWLRMAPDDLDD
jgi:hypothetical protein